MSKQLAVLLSTALCTTVGLGQAIAAEPLAQVKFMKGDVLINQGERFITAHEGMALQQLDRVIALEGSGVGLEFQDGCQYQMKEMELLTVGAVSPCKAGGRDYQVVKQTATSQIAPPAGATTGTTTPGGGTAAGTTAGEATAGAAGGTGAAGAGTAGAGAAGAGAAGAGAAGAGAAAAGAGAAAAGLGVAGIGAGTIAAGVAVAGAAVAGVTAVAGGDDDEAPAAISPQ